MLNQDEGLYSWKIIVDVVSKANGCRVLKRSEEEESKPKVKDHGEIKIFSAQGLKSWRVGDHHNRW